ncbi:unnamed protein product [Caenorhabditis angaria]|uniref:Serpentine Receptor, class BC (Class B-like) n=1 Tax=Caenorhabditis angaria TaxID=860376 RepID=A0A9P1IXA5_9PELO|nr:unnamed protein product [Caenorhabditis angaria]
MPPEQAERAIVSSRITPPIAEMFVSPKSESKEIRLIIVRTILDIAQGVLNLIFLVLTILHYLMPYKYSYDYIFRSGGILVLITVYRTFLAITIELERLWASFFPISFSKKRQNISNSLILLILLVFPAIEEIMMIGVFPTVDSPMSNCSSFICGVSDEYKRFTAYYTFSYGAVNFLLSFILCTKLFVLYKQRNAINNSFMRINILCITDGLCSFFFDFIPAILFYTKVIIIRDAGPVVSTVRLIGRVLEASVLCYMVNNAPKPKEVQTINNNNCNKI